jgi:hypothetical protein
MIKIFAERTRGKGFVMKELAEAINKSLFLKSGISSTILN